MRSSYYSAVEVLIAVGLTMVSSCLPINMYSLCACVTNKVLFVLHSNRSNMLCFCSHVDYSSINCILHVSNCTTDGLVGVLFNVQVVVLGLTIFAMQTKASRTQILACLDTLHRHMDTLHTRYLSVDCVKYPYGVPVAEML